MYESNAVLEHKLNTTETAENNNINKWSKLKAETPHLMGIGKPLPYAFYGNR